MFNRLRLRTKLALLLGLSGLAIIACIAFGALTLRDRMTEDRVQELRSVVQSTISIARELEARVDAGKITREQAVARMRDVIHPLRFNGGNGYISIVNDDGDLIIHGADPSLEGKPSPAADSDGSEMPRPAANAVISIFQPWPRRSWPPMI